MTYRRKPGRPLTGSGDVVRVFIGFDREEAVASGVLIHSLMRHASGPVSITPMVLGQLPMTRMRAEYQSTDFSFSRFLVPYLCGYEGRAIFMDCDMLCRADIYDLWRQTDTHHAVHVVKHDYIPHDAPKFLGQRQSVYEKKNWSSLMVFNNPMCKTLTPKVVNEASGLYLHQFKWLQDDSLIGSLNMDWNHLVGEYPVNHNAKLVHFTLGTPCFKAFSRCEFSDEWYKEQDLMLDYNKLGEFKREVRTGT